jgi:hypothetical protein
LIQVRKRLPLSAASLSFPRDDSGDFGSIMPDQIAILSASKLGLTGAAISKNSAWSRARPIQ